METIDPFAQVPAPLRAAIEARGFEKLTAVQEAVLSAEGEGRNLRISSQTGSGKTLALGLRLACDLLPETDSGEPLPKAEGPRALLITPTRELAVQVAEELRWLLAKVPGVTVEVVTGGSDPVREKRALKKSPAVLVGTPGRLLDHRRAVGPDEASALCRDLRHHVDALRFEVVEAQAHGLDGDVPADVVEGPTQRVVDVERPADPQRGFAEELDLRDAHR